MADFTLYAFAHPSRAERIVWVLQEVGASFDIVRMDALKAENRSETFLKLNPAGKVPCLVHHRPGHADLVMTESVAIMYYLADWSGKNDLMPTSPEDRYLVNQRIAYLVAEFEAYLWSASQAKILSSIYHWPEGTIEECVSRLNKALPEIESWLTQSGYAAGNQFTIADVYCAHVLRWAKRFKLRYTENCMAYLEKLTQRPAYPDFMKPNQAKSG